MTTIRFGIIGLGDISNRFAKVLKTASGVELVAVAARDQSRSNAFAKKYGAKHAYASYQAVIDDPEVDIIYDGLTHNFHYEWTRHCLESHKAVLCEKPFVTSQKDAEELVALAREKKTFLMEAMWTRCMPAFQQARTWVKEGRIGEVKLITSHFNFKAENDPNNRWFNPALAGGSLFDVGIYPIDLATGILNETPVEVNGTAVISETGIDAASAIALRFGSGAVASLSCGFLADTSRNATIYGTEGRIELDKCTGPVHADLFDSRGKRQERFFKPVADGFIYQIEHSAQCLRDGRLESDMIPLADTIATAGIFDQLRRQWGLIK
jgi:predicted dehydrogenase